MAKSVRLHGRWQKLRLRDIELCDLQKPVHIILQREHLRTSLEACAIPAGLRVAEIRDCVLGGELGVKESAHAQSVDVEVFQPGEIVCREADMVNCVSEGCGWAWSVGTGDEASAAVSTAWVTGCCSLNGEHCDAKAEDLGCVHVDLELGLFGNCK